MSRITRRLAITGGGALVLASAAYGGSLLACSRHDSAALRHLGDPERLFAAIPSIREASRVGAAVLSGAVAEGPLPLDPDRLLPALASRAALRRACRIDCPATRAGHLAETFRAEMAGGRHVVAAGWVVSPSEARIAALWVAARRSVPS